MKFSEYILLGLLLFAVNFLFNGAARAVDAGRVALGEWQTAGKVEEFTKRLEGSNMDARPDALEAARTLKRHLAETGRRLTVVLVPTRASLMQKEWVLDEKPTSSVKRLDVLGKALTKHHVDCISLIPDAYQEALKDSSTVFRDRSHFTKEFEEKLARCLLKHTSIDEDSLLIGDSFASVMLNAFSRVKPEVQPRCLWKNNASHLMACEMVCLDEADLHQVEEVVWFITDSALNAAERKFLPAPEEPEVTKNGYREVYATLEAQSYPADSIVKNSTTDDALAVNKFRTDDGAYLLGVVRVMSKRVIDEPVQLWKKQARYRLRLAEWDLATALQEELKTLDTVDTVREPTLPKYHVTGWLYAPVPVLGGAGLLVDE